GFSIGPFACSSRLVAPPVPELQGAIGGIDAGRRVPRTFFASDANRGGVNVGKPRLQRMAGCTRDRVVPGKPRIVVEFRLEQPSRLLADCPLEGQGGSSRS